MGVWIVSQVREEEKSMIFVIAAVITLGTEVDHDVSFFFFFF